MSVPEQQVFDVVGVVNSTDGAASRHRLLLHLLVGDFSLQLLELLNKHVVEGVEVLGQLTRGSTTTHPLERQLLLLLEPDFVSLLIQRFILNTLRYLDHMLRSQLHILLPRLWHLLISPVNHHFPDILGNVGLEAVDGCQVLAVGHVEGD